MPHKFTDSYLKNLHLPPGRKDRIEFDTECRGLGVRLTAKGTRTFLAQWTDPATKERVREPLGVWGAITIEQARKAVQARLGDVAKGIDLKAEREKRRKAAEQDRAERALILERLIDDWSSLHLARRRERYRTEAVRALKYAFADFLKRPAAHLSKADVVNVLDSMVKAGKASMAGRTLAYGHAAFRWAQQRGKVPQNPFDGLPKIEGSRTERCRVLTDQEISDAWVAADTLGYPFGPLFRLELLTMQRRDEVAGMRWSQLSPDLSVWDLTVKGGKPNIVHLPQIARDTIMQIPRIDGCGFVFSTTGKSPVSGFSKAKTRLLAAIEQLRRTRAADDDPQEAKPENGPWSVHDFRRSGATTLARLGIDPIVVDMILSHKPYKLRGVAAIYQRYDFAKERKHALEVWATHVSGLVGPDTSEIVDGPAEQRSAA